MVKKATYEELERRVRDLERRAAKRKKAEEALLESEMRLSEIVHGSLIPTFVIDREHTITHCNKAYENLKGVSAEKMIGTKDQWITFYPHPRPTMADLIVDNAPEKEIARYYGGRARRSALVEGGYEAENFFPGLGKRGQWLYFGAAPLRDAGGNITGAIEILLDITERKTAEMALRKSERRYRTLLDFVPYPVVVFAKDGRVSYLNPEFTEVFGWSLEELQGRIIPFVPPGLKEKFAEDVRKLFEEGVFEEESKRLTRDGRILDVSVKVAFYPESEEEESEVILILRDITHEKKMAATNEAMLRISLALPQYPDLEDLLDYVSSEIRRVLNVEGALVILLDQATKELFFLGTAYEDRATEKKAKEIRYPADRGISGKVVRTGQPIIVPDTSKEPAYYYGLIDEKLGFQSRNMMDVPLRSGDRIIGVLCAINKKEGSFDQADIDLLSMIGGTVALSIENARVSEELKRSYREVASLNRAKDKAIDHLSHELKTPIAVLFGALNILRRELTSVPREAWKSIMEMARRNVERINEIQYEAEDIMEDKQARTHRVLTLLLDECADELATLIAEEVGETGILQRVRERIDELFGPKEVVPQKLLLYEFVAERLEALKPQFSHRNIEIITRLDETPPIYMPLDPLRKVVEGLVRNAIENTPDAGKIEIAVHRRGEGTELVVHDYGVGIVEEDQKRIFEGFFTTRETMDYSSKRPFDFNAGGKGADLLRMKIFSERYNFTMNMTSSRCRFIPKAGDLCPGRIDECAYCKTTDDCYGSGGTAFSLYFPPARTGGRPSSHDRGRN